MISKIYNDQKKDRSAISTYTSLFKYKNGGRRGRDCVVIGFTTTYMISDYRQYRCEFETAHDEVYPIQHYVIKFVSDLR